MYWPSAKNFVIYCLICLFWSVQFCAAIPYGKEIAHSHKHSVSGCLHNNTMYADTSIVPSTEPCLVCKCSKRNLVCVRKVCKDQPYPPPRGCILVQKKSLCCPYLSCSKYHVNFYKNAERNREHINNNYQITHEKTLEKHYRTDDDNTHPNNYDDMNGGCIESGSLYASGSAMYRSSGSLCTYCYCINGQQKCIKPKCVLRTSRCKPLFMEGSCCPIKYDCNSNSTTESSGTEIIDSKKEQIHECFESGRFYQEGERLPSNDQRPCEVCYCIKGARKCAVKKCAPVIHGCVPKLPANGACCPTSYDCRRRSLKFKRHSRQEDEDDVEEDTDTIDFFSLLFGSDDPKEEEVTQEASTTVAPSTLPPFKSLPSSSSTESSFFDFIRAGLEIIDANADNIDSQINKVITTTPVALLSTEQLITTTEVTRKTFETSTPSSKIKTSATSSKSETKKLPSSTQMPKTSPLPASSSSTLSIKSSTELPTTLSLQKVSTQRTTSKTTISPVVKMSSMTLAKKPAATTRKTTSKAPPSTTVQTASTPIFPPKTTESTLVKTTMKKTSIITTQPPPKTTTIRKVFVQTTSNKRPLPTIAPQKFIVPSLVGTLQQQRLPSIVHFNADVLPDKKYAPSKDNDDDNEADTLPNLEIIPFVAHDAIRTDKYEPYLSHSLEKDYFATNEGGGVGAIVSGYETEKPFRYNNKFIHHNYDDSLDYVYTNPHERIDNGPYYFENQFESFSPPNEQDFLGGFSPKETVYDEVSTSTKVPLPPTLHSHPNDSQEKTLNTSVTQEHKSSEKTLINQTFPSDVEQQQTSTTAATTVPGFKKISSNFTSFIDDLLQVNALDDTKAPLVLSTTPITSTIKSTSTIAPLKSIINDDDFIKKHLKATSTSTSFSKSSQKQQSRPQSAQQQQKKQQTGTMEIFSKPTNPTMNGLLKLAGCNIYGQMYDVGQVIAELSNPCYECKCLPDIGVGCMPLC